MDRSKRATNPQNYNPDGTTKKGVKLRWNFSNKYTKTRQKLKDTYRKQADVRKLQHEEMANYVISLGHQVYVETMSFKGLQKKSKETKKDDKGKFKRKKRFGKSLANKAPAMLLTIIERKLSYYGLPLFRIDTKSVKASQYNHVDDNYAKKKLSQRWNYFDDLKIQRDLYSAFLIMNVDDDLKTINKEQCNIEFDNFLKLHEKEIERLKISQLNKISSMGI